VRFLCLASFVVTCVSVVPAAMALPLESELSPVAAMPFQQSTPAAQPQSETQNTPRSDDPGEVEVNPKLPEGAPPAPATEQQETTPQTAPQTAPSSPAVTPEAPSTPQPSGSPKSAGAKENPPLPKVYKPSDPVRHISSAGSTYIPMDSWMYPALDRLAGLGYIDTAFFGERPWTRLNVAHMLEITETKLDDNPQDTVARELFSSLQSELLTDLRAPQVNAHVESVYGNLLQIGGQPLTDSFHFGQTIINNYGRPYADGFNLQLGGSARAEAGRFTLYVRGEYQHAPGLAAEPLSVQSVTSIADSNIGVPNSFATGTRDNFRILNAYLGYHVWGTEISVGKSDMWWGPAQGGAMLYSNNAEPIYMLRINRVEPLYIPFLSRIIGTIRTDNFFGDFKGHRSPNNPWVFGNKVSIHPTKDLEFGFSRTDEFAGKGYHPLTFGNFWNSFTSVGDQPNAGERAYDVGDRRGGFDFRWRLPFLRKSVTIYTDSICDDDPSPLANFRRSSWRPGIYISHLPGAPRFDLRFEAPYSNQAHSAGITYTNHAYKDGYTNKGFLVADWIGRDSTGYQGWLTYWLSPREQVQAQYRDSKIDTRLWAGGGSQTDFSVKLVKRLSRNIELNTSVQYERWWIPLLHTGKQSDVSGNLQITWYPKIGLSR